MRVRRSTVESLIINLVMVKEEDKGRGCIPVHSRGGVFRPDFFQIISEMLQYPKETEGRTKKIPI
jgi:hypothetical protein